MAWKYSRGICAHVCICSFVFLHLWVLCMCRFMDVYLCMQVYVFMHIYLYVWYVFYVCIYVSIYLHMCRCTCIYVYVHTHAYLWVGGMGVCICILYLFICFLVYNMVILNVPCYYVVFWELWENVIITLESKILFIGNCRASWWIQVYHINSQNNVPLGRSYIPLCLPTVVWRKWIPKGMALLVGVALMQ